MKTLYSLLLCIGVGAGLYACDSKDQKDELEEPRPAAAYSLMRYVLYPATAELAGLKYPPASLKGQGTLSAEVLYTRFYNKQDSSSLSFSLPANKLKAGVVGHYSLQSQPDMAAGDAEFHYALAIPNDDSGKRIYNSHWNKATGYLHVTSYNEKLRLLSGTYEVKLANLYDPLDPSPLPSDKRADMTLSGEFTNLPLQ